MISYKIVIIDLKKVVCGGDYKNVQRVYINI